MAKPLRVAVTLEQCWHRVPGGTAVAALGIARALAGHGQTEPVGVAARHRHEPDSEWTPTISVEHLGLPRLALYESWHRFRRPRVENATGPVDVIHATSLAVPPRSTTLVVTIHDLAFLHEPSHFTKRGLSFFHRGLELARGEADAVHCPSQATATDCIANGFEPDRVHVAHLGIDPAPPIPDATERVRARFGIEEPFVLWTGTVEPRKNLRRMLQAWSNADTGSATLVLVGPEGWNEDIGELVERTGDVRSLGFVDRAWLGELYAAATMLCWPSLREGFGFPVLEAMAHGCPVITSRGTSTEEIAGDAAVLVDPTDTDQISGAITSLLADTDRRDQLERAGRARAGSFTWARTAEQLHETYRTSIGVAA